MLHLILSSVDPECVGRANLLVVKLGENNKVKNSTVLTLKTGNGIKQLKAQDNYDYEASGTVTVMARADDRKSKPEFSLSGPSEICPGSPVKIVVNNMKGFGRGKREFTWDTDSPAGSDLYNLVKQNNKHKLKINSNMVSFIKYL